MNFLTEVTATEAVTEAVTEAAKMQFEPMAFIGNLKYMGIGMLVIFVIIGVIILATKLVSTIKSK
jgi:hypothetical protein